MLENKFNYYKSNRLSSCELKTGSKLIIHRIELLRTEHKTKIEKFNKKQNRQINNPIAFISCMRFSLYR